MIAAFACPICGRDYTLEAGADGAPLAPTLCGGFDHEDHTSVAYVVNDDHRRHGHAPSEEHEVASLYPPHKPAEVVPS